MLSLVYTDASRQINHCRRHNSPPIPRLITRQQDRPLSTTRETVLRPNKRQADNTTVETNIPTLTDTLPYPSASTLIAALLHAPLPQNRRCTPFFLPRRRCPRCPVPRSPKHTRKTRRKYKIRSALQNTLHDVGKGTLRIYSLVSLTATSVQQLTYSREGAFGDIQHGCTSSTRLFYFPTYMKVAQRGKGVVRFSSLSRLAAAKLPLCCALTENVIPRTNVRHPQQIDTLGARTKHRSTAVSTPIQQPNDQRGSTSKKIGLQPPAAQHRHRLLATHPAPLSV